MPGSASGPVPAGLLVFAGAGGRGAARRRQEENFYGEMTGLFQRANKCRFSKGRRSLLKETGKTREPHAAVGSRVWARSEQVSTGHGDDRAELVNSAWVVKELPVALVTEMYRSSHGLIC